MSELTSKLRLHNSYTSELFREAADRISELESHIVISEDDLRFAVRAACMPVREWCESNEVNDLEASIIDKVKKGNRV